MDNNKRKRKESNKKIYDIYTKNILNIECINKIFRNPMQEMYDKIERQNALLRKTYESAMIGNLVPNNILQQFKIDENIYKLTSICNKFNEEYVNIPNAMKINIEAFDNIIKSVNLERIFEKYNITSENIKNEEVEIREDGTVKYDDEIISINQNTEQIIERLNAIENDISDINGKIPGKDRKIVIIFKWLLEYFFMPLLVSLIAIPVQVKYEIETTFNEYVEDNKLKEKPKDEQQKLYTESYVQVDATELNVREKPSVESKLIGKLYRYQCVRIIEKVPHWTKVEYINKKEEISIKGWVYTRYLLRFDENIFEWISMEEGENIYGD